MQKLQCELCNSIDFIRTDDGFFQCQHCGCKYTLEQARTILSGTVEIIAGEKTFERELENLYKLKELGDCRCVAILNELEMRFPDHGKVWELRMEIITEEIKEKSAPDQILYYESELYIKGIELLDAYNKAVKTYTSSDDIQRIQNRMVSAIGYYDDLLNDYLNASTKNSQIYMIIFLVFIRFFKDAKQAGLSDQFLKQFTSMQDSMIKSFCSWAEKNSFFCTRKDSYLGNYFFQGEGKTFFAIQRTFDEGLRRNRQCIYCGSPLPVFGKCKVCGMSRN